MDRFFANHSPLRASGTAEERQPDNAAEPRRTKRHIDQSFRSADKGSTPIARTAGAAPDANAVRASAAAAAASTQMLFGATPYSIDVASFVRGNESAPPMAI